MALKGRAAAGHTIYNVGNRVGFSVRRVVEVARGITGRTIEVSEAPRRSGDPAILVASGRRIREELGWAPEKPALATMIADAWTWMQSYGYAARLGRTYGEGRAAFLDARSYLRTESGRRQPRLITRVLLGLVLIADRKGAGMGHLEGEKMCYLAYVPSLAAP